MRDLKNSMKNTPKKISKKLQLDNNELEYELERKHVKNINVRIKPNRICVSAGHSVPLQYIESFLISKKDYILKTLNQYSQTEYILMKGEYENGEAVYILGDLFFIELHSDREAVYFEGEKIILSVKDREDKGLRVRVMNKWLKQLCTQAVDAAMEKVYPAFAAYNVRYPQIRLRNMTSRWGSCQPVRGVVTFNTALIHVPEKCLEYVAAHELAHFLHADHSKGFYENLNAVMPDWKERKKLLEKYGRAVIAKRDI